MPLSYDWSALATALADLKALVGLGIASRFTSVEDSLATQIGRVDSLDAKATTLEAAQLASGEQSAQRYNEFTSFKEGVNESLQAVNTSASLLAGRVETLESADPTQVLSRLSALELEDVDVKSRLSSAEAAKVDAEARLDALAGEDVDVKARLDALESATAISSRLEALEAAINALSEQFASYAPQEPPAE